MSVNKGLWRLELGALVLLTWITSMRWASGTEAPEHVDSEQKRYAPFAALGAPVLISVGITYRHNPHWMAFFDVGYGPLPILVSGAIDVARVGVGERWIPHEKGIFFLGFGLGYQTIRYHRELNLGTITGDMDPSMSVIYLNHLFVSGAVGWMWQVNSGLALGMNLGLQFPLYGWGGLTMNQDSAGSKSLERASQDSLSSYATWVTPYITLLEARW